MYFKTLLYLSRMTHIVWLISQFYCINPTLIAIWYQYIIGEFILSTFFERVVFVCRIPELHRMFVLQFNLCHCTSRDWGHFYPDIPACPTYKDACRSQIALCFTRTTVPLKELWFSLEYPNTLGYRLPPVPGERVPVDVALLREGNAWPVAARLWTGFRTAAPLKNAPPSAVIILIDTQARPRPPGCPARATRSHARACIREMSKICARAARPGPTWQGTRSGPGERKTHASARLLPSADRGRRIPRRERGHAWPQETRGLFVEYRHESWTRRALASDVTMTQSDRECKSAAHAWGNRGNAGPGYFCQKLAAVMPKSCWTLDSSFT